VTTILNGCDLAILSGDAPPWAPEGVGEGDLLVVSTGTHGLANGLGAVLDAAAVLPRRGRADIRIALVGEGATKGLPVLTSNPGRIADLIADGAWWPAWRSSWPAAAAASTGS
jgi:hypothetical protein